MLQASEEADYWIQIFYKDNSCVTVSYTHLHHQNHHHHQLLQTINDFWPPEGDSARLADTVLLVTFSKLKFFYSESQHYEYMI